MESIQKFEKPIRPYLFRTACYVGFVYYGLISLIFLIAFIAVLFNNKLIKIYSEQYGILKEGFLLQGLFAFVLFGLSLISMILIWQRKKIGIFILAGSNIILIIIQLFSESLNWINILVTTIIVIITLIFIKKVQEIRKVKD